MVKLCLMSLLGLAQGIKSAWVPPPEYAIQISRNGRFFQDVSGKPFFWQADTAWMLTHRLNITEVETYLADRAEKGYNIVLTAGVNLKAIDDPNRNGDFTFHDNNISRPNEAYWSHIDNVAELAWKKYHIRIGLIPAWGKYAHTDTGPGPITAENGVAFGQFIGKRYPYLPKVLFGDTNPYWADSKAIENEYKAGGVPRHHPSVDYTPIYDAVARGIVAGERAITGKRSYKPLITIHPRNQWMPDAPLALASSNFENRDWLTFDAAQSGHADTPPHPPIPWWNARRGYETVELMWQASTSRRPLPVIDNEPHYERRWSRKDSVNDKRPWNASDVRIGTWQTAFSGAAGITHGNDNVWQIYIPGLYEHEGGGVPVPWFDSIKDEGSVMMQFVSQAIMDRCRSTFFNRIPAQDIFSGDTGKYK